MIILFFRGVLKADLALGHLNINQCGTDGQGMISFGIHRCPDNSKVLVIDCIAVIYNPLMTVGTYLSHEN